MVYLTFLGMILLHWQDGKLVTDLPSHQLTSLHTGDVFAGACIYADGVTYFDEERYL
jgi:hypothetical protein